MPSLPTSATEDALSVQPARHQTGLITIVFTDLVGSTALKQQVGDRTGASLIQQHHALVRELLRGFSGGEEIETAGDSFLIIFTKPSDAVHFGLQLNARLRTLNQGLAEKLQDRIGIHVGEVVIREQDGSPNPKGLTGIQVDTCARVMGLAQGGQLLLTRSAFDSARQMLKGEDVAGVGQLEWLNHGPYLLKGIEASLEVCEVGEVGIAPLQAPAGSEKAQRQVSPESEPVLGWRPAVGQFVPNTRWRLETKLGEGGFGEVWLGRHQHTKERRVFKFCFQADRVRFLKREMTLFRVLKERVGDHANIVRLHDIMLDHPPFYVEMDYVEGADLRSWSAQRGGVEAIPLATRLEIAAQAADGLQAAHEAGIIHRDIKPVNILVSESHPQPVSGHPLPSDGTEPGGEGRVRVKLTDFGIGQVVSEESLKGITRAGFTQTILSDSPSSHTGTQLYMAPELLAGKPASTRSDIYSLGVVLYQLLVGDFSRPVTTDWAEQVANPLLREDLKRCFAGNPQDRFAGAGQLAEQLRTLERRQAARLEREQAECASQRRRRAAIFVSGCAIMALLLSGAMGYGLRRAWQSEQQLRRNLYVADMKVAYLALSEGNRGLATTLVDKYSHQTGTEELRGFEWRYLWKRCQGREQFTLHGHSNRVTALAFVMDNKTLFSGGSDGVVKVWDLAFRKELTAVGTGSEWIEDMAVSPTGSALFVGRSTGVAVLDGPSFTSERRLPGAQLPLALSPDGQTLLTGGTNGIIIWDAAHGQRLQTLRQFTNGRFAFSPDRGTVAIAVRTDAQVEIRLWNLASLKANGDQDKPLSFSHQGTNDLGEIAALAFSRDGQMLAAGHERGVQLWDAKGGPPLSEPQASDGRVAGIAFLPDAKTMVTSGPSRPHDFQVWDISTRTNIVAVEVVPGHLNEIWALAQTSDGQQLASGGKDGSIKLWSANAFQDRPGSKDQTGGREIGQVSFSQDGHTLFTVSSNSALAFWETATLQPVASHALPGNVRLAVMSPAGKQLAVGLANGAVQVWNVLDRASSLQFDRELFSPQANLAEPRFAPRAGHTNEFPLMTWSADGKRLAAFLDEVHVWDGTTGQTIRKLPLQAKPWSIALSRNGTILAVGLDTGPSSRRHWATGFSQNVELWDLTTEQKLPTCVGHRDITVELTFSPDGSTLATASLDNTVGLWRVSTGTLKFSLTSHTLGVFHVVFSPDGRTLATLGGGNALKLWNVETGRELMTFKPSATEEFNLLAGVRFSPDGTTLAVGLLSPPQIRVIRAPAFAEIDAPEAVRSSN